MKTITKIKCPCGHSHHPDSKVLKNHTNHFNPTQTTPSSSDPHLGANNQQESVSEKAIESTFLDKNGKLTKIKDIIDKEDCWQLKKKNQSIIQWIISNKGMRKIAEVAGVGKNYEVEESSHIVPKPENSFLHIVKITIHCFAKKENGCVHDENQNWLSSSGEADKLNTSRGSTYLRTMAEKRGYDIAVRRHLGIDNVYSEVEAEAFETSEEDKKNADQYTNEDLEKVAPALNMILNAKDKNELTTAVKFIKERVFPEIQIQILRQQYKKKYSELVEEF